jgi:MFS family permease
MIMSTDARPTGIYSWYVVLLLSALYVVSFIDRVVLNLLVDPLRAEFGLSDTQISLLQGAAFAIFYGVFGLPLARIADVGNRKILIIAGVVVWSLATISSAFATGFAMLVALRAGLAIGEAALSPAALSMFADLFDKDKRSLPCSIYVAAGLVGSFAAFIVGSVVVDWVEAGGRIGPLAALEPWRAVFVLVGLPGLVLAVLMAVTVREPCRITGPKDETPSLRQVMGVLQAQPRLYIGMLVGGGLLAIVTSSLPAWVPSLLIRNHGFSIAQAGAAYGLIGVAASALGTILIPRIADAWMRRGRADALLTVFIAAVLAGTPAMAFFAVADDATTLLLTLGIAIFLWYGAVAIPILAVQQVAPPRMRATFTAGLFFVKTFIGFASGPTIVAVLSDYMFGGEQTLGLALMTLTLIIAPLSLMLVALARRPFATVVAAS